MKLLTRDTDYAIRAVTCIAANHGEIHNVGELTGKLDIPRPFLRKIMQIMQHNGILESIRGKTGGFRLVADPSKISVLNLIEIFQGPFQMDQHIFKKKVCPRVKICVLKKKLDKIEASVKKELNTITMTSLIENKKK